MSRRLGKLGLLLLVIGLTVGLAPAGELFPDRDWQIAPSPETVGWSSDALAQAREFAGTINTE